MTHTLHGLSDSYEYPYELFLAHKYLCYSHMFSCMLSHVPISTRMTIRFCVILIGLCDQVSSFIFGSRLKLFEVLFVTGGVPLSRVVLDPFELFLFVQVIYLVVYSFIRDFLLFDRVAF